VVLIRVFVSQLLRRELLDAKLALVGRDALVYSVAVRLGANKATLGAVAATDSPYFHCVRLGRRRGFVWNPFLWPV
jgi:hypothetical protein